MGLPDLLTMLAAWGLNPGVPPNIDGDGTVGVPNLLVQLAACGLCWG